MYRWLLGMGIVAAVGIWGLIAADKTRPKTPTPLESAVPACEQFVIERLRAPKTATFVPGAVGEWVAPGSKQVKVTGSVDAQNGFGALIRNTYTCIVEQQPSESTPWWTLVDLSLTSR